MENLIKKTLLVLFGSALLGCSALLLATCCGRSDFRNREGSVCPNFNCNYERGDKHCSSDSECCPGKQCNSFGFCERCR